MRIFVDSDVIISSLISQSGASYALLTNTEITPVISTLSHQELDTVIQRLKLSKNDFISLLQRRLAVVNISHNVEEIKKKYARFVLDENDAHIIAGAVEAQVYFLVSYNQRHYLAAKIKKGLNISLFTPGTFLQYLRSR